MKKERKKEVGKVIYKLNVGFRGNPSSKGTFLTSFHPTQIPPYLSPAAVHTLLSRH